ncbi:MAG: gag polymerase env [Lasallia pustulata]|uniref:Gag polymerase env n=1 Tax=Lasallia pustulata TaxID=136370 RepID=A0A5M8PV95_9LECA|nr:MAG: gag polymerase env [Lasallia pustulata]
MPALQTRNVAGEQLNLVAGTVGCKQLIPRVMVKDLATHETVIDSPSQILIDMIRTIQSTDAFVLGKRKAANVPAKRKAKTGKLSPWRFDSEGLLFYKEQVYVPEEESVWAELLKRHHDDILAGHFGVERTLELVKVPRHRPYGSLTLLPQPEGPWQQIAMDFITGLPSSKRKGIIYDAILVVIDCYTKMARYIPTTKTITAVDLAELFFEEIIYKQDNWTALLPLAEFAYNNGTQSSLGCSPFYALYGYHPQVQFHVGDNARKEEVPAAKERVKHVHDIHEALEQRYQNVVKMQAKHYDAKHKPQTYNVGDLIMLSTKNLRLKRPSRKMSHKFIGPFRIKDLIGTQAYRLTLPSTYQIHDVFHVSYLEPYNRRQGDGSTPTLQPPELMDDGEEYEVEEILDKTKHRKEIWYKVKWKEWLKEYDQWVHESDMEGAQDLRSEYNKKHAEAVSRKQKKKRRT